MADIKNFGIVGVGTSVQYGKGGGSLKWDTDGFVSTTDGTTLAHFDAANVNFTGLSGTGAVSVTDILDEDNMASDSATALATQQSIKAYVDSQVGATTLTGTGDSGAFSVDLDSETFGVFGGTNLTSTGSGSNVTVALDADISLTSVTATGTIEGGSLTDGTATLTGGNLTGAGDITATGTITGGTLTDGTASITGGDLSTTGDVTAANVTATNGVFTNNISERTTNAGITFNHEVLGGQATFTGQVQFGSLSDGTISVDAFESTLSGNASNVATSEAVKNYVDAAVSASDLDFAGDTGTGAVDLDSQVFTIAGGTGLSSVGGSQTLTMNIDNTGVSAGTYGDATNIPQFTVNAQGQITSASNVAIQTSWTLTGDSGSETVNGGDTVLVAGGTNITTAVSATDTVTIDLDDDITLAGNVTAVNGTFTGEVTFGSGSGGSMTGLQSIEAVNVSATGNLIVGGYAVTDILDEDDMISDSDTALATQQSIKAYVDAVATAADLDFAGDSGTGAVDLDSQTFTVAGGTGMTSAAVGQTLTMNLDNTGVTAGDYGSATNIPAITVNAQGQITSATNVAIQTSWTLTGDSGSETVNGGDTVLIAGGDNITTAVTATDTATINLDTTLTNMVGATFSGTVQAGTFTDGTLSITSGAITGATDITATGTIQGNTLRDSILTINGGAISGATTGSFSGTVSAGNLDASGGLVTFNQLSDGTLTMDAILDEDNMASDSDTALATQQSIKAYVDSQISLQGAAMNIQGDTGTGSIVFATETLDIAGTANEIETSFDNGTNTMTIGLPDDVTMGNLTVNGTFVSDDITSGTVTITGDMNVVGDTVMQGNLTVQGNTTIVNSNTITTGDNVITLNADLPSTQAPSQDMGILMNRGSSANVEILWLETVDYFVFRDENGDLQEVRADEFNADQFTGGNATITGDVAFGTLTDTGEGITIDKFVDEADGIANNDNDTTIPTTAAVIDYVTNNAGDGNLIRNGSVGTGASTVTIGTVPNVAGRSYYVEKVVIKVTVGFSGNSVDHIILSENGGLGTQIVAEPDADIVTGTYVVESDGATQLTAGQTILLGFRDSGNNLVAPTAGACSVAVYYGWV